MRRFSRLVFYFLILAWILVAQFEWTQQDVTQRKLQAEAVTPAAPALPTAE